MTFRSRLTIRTKLIVLVVAAVLCAQTIIAGVLIRQEISRYAQTRRESLQAAAEVIAAGSAQALTRRNPVEIRAVLRAIGRIPGVLYVSVSDNAGQQIADLGATEQLDSDVKFDGRPISVFALLSSRTAELSSPMISGGLTIGRLRIISDTSDLPGRLRDALRTTMIGALFALLLGLLVALRLQRSISRPLGELTRAMEQVGQRHDYAIELQQHSRDEIGVLVSGFNKMLFDIRERDARLARHRERLETEVAERTEDFRQAKESAEAANSAKTDFLATMSHEIRTPMNGILVMADLLAAGDLPPRSRRYAEVIAHSGQGLVAIINDILDFSKIEAGKLQVEMLAVDCFEAVDNAVSLFTERAQSKGLDLCAVIEPDAPRWVAGDPVRLNQVLGNLINNALKFTESGSVAVRVERDSERLRFAVADTGIGIAEDKRATIFGAFSQADQSTARRFGGTGLGLSISQRLVAAMGGDIAVTSCEGEGSTFSFSLAIAEDVTESWPRVAVNGESKACICIDGAATAAALSAYLSASCFEVSAADPLNLPRGNDSPALIFAGVATLHALPERPWPGATLVVALAQLGQPGGDSLVARGIADICLDKPLNRADIREILGALAEGRDPRIIAAQRQQQPATTQYPAARVLVVDDGAVNREVALEALRNFGIAAQLAGDGAQALELSAREHFDLILMDGSMPVMDGYEASRRIRLREAGTATARQTIVALTAHVVGPTAQAWRAAGMDGVLHKPFTLTSLAACLSEWLGAGEAAADEMAAAATADPVLDPAVIAQMRDLAAIGRGDFAARVTGLYRQHAPAALGQIAAARASGDLQALAAAAHALKSMSLNIGAVRVSALAGAIEANARENRANATDVEASSLEAALNRAIEALGEIGLAA